MHTDHHDDERGSSLIEVVLATVLVVVFVGALLTFTTRQGSHRQTNQETSLALSAALDNIERVRTVSATVLPTLNGAGFDVPGVTGAAGGLTAVPGDPDGLPGQLEVVTDPANPPLGGAAIYRVAAVVTWKGVSGVRSLRLESLVTERK